MENGDQSKRGCLCPPDFRGGEVITHMILGEVITHMILGGEVITHMILGGK